MFILNWYVTRSFLGTFFMAIGILTFAMMGARLLMIFELIAKGLPLVLFFKFVLYTLPVVLSFTVPWAVMVAIILVFGRLSADSEITAMRACGVSILQIMAPILLITFLLSGICFYLQVQVGPPSLFKTRVLQKNVIVESPMVIFDPGQYTEHENFLIYVYDKPAPNTITGVQIYELDPKMNIIRDIAAASGVVEIDEATKVMNVRLKNCMVVDKTQGQGISSMLDEAVFSLNYAEEFNSWNLTNRYKFLTMPDLLARIRLEREMNRETCDMETELNQRIAFALAPIAFLLFGLPLSIRTSRKETSIGLFLSVILAGFFFLAVIICESLTSHPNLYPQYLLWLPTLIYQICGAWMIVRLTRR